MNSLIRQQLAARRLITALAILVGTHCPRIASSQDPEAVLKELQSQDACLSNGLYVVSEFVVPPPRNNEFPPCRMNCRFTCWDKKFAIVEQHIHFVADSDAEIRKPALSRSIAVPLRIVTVFDDEKSATHRTVALENTAAGEPVVGGRQSAIVMYYSPDDVSLTLTPLRAKWSLGRGFSQHLTSIQQVTELADGQLRLVCKGTNGPTQAGLWDIVVDRNSGWIVRSATFTQNGRDKPLFEVATDGVMRNEECSVAKHATVTINVGDRKLTYDFANQSLMNRANQAFFAQADSVFSEELPKGSHVLDYRGKGRTEAVE